MNTPVKFLIVANLRTASGRMQFSGMLDYMASKRHWEPYLIDPWGSFDRDCLRKAQKENFAGIIITLPGDEPTMRVLAGMNIPTVFANIPKLRLPPQRKNVSFVWTDNFDIGEKGARHLLSLGNFNSFGFVHSLSHDREYGFWSNEREAAFRRTVKPNCRHYAVFTGGSLKKWVANLPRPAAIMAAYDARGAEILVACRELKLDVPEQVSVIGVDNDETWFEGTDNPLSTIVPDLHAIGWKTTEELDRLIRQHGKGRANEIVVPAKELIIRDSTRHIAPSAKIVSDIHAFIAKNLQNDIHVEDIVRHLGCSRRLAELRFRQTEGTSIRAAIETARLAKARNLILHTSRSLTSIARHCGFKSPVRLSHLIRKHWGSSTREMRKDNGLSEKIGPMVAP